MWKVGVRGRRATGEINSQNGSAWKSIGSRETIPRPYLAQRTATFGEEETTLLAFQRQGG